MRIKIWSKSDIEVTDNYDILWSTLLCIAASPQHAGARWIILQFTPIHQSEPSVSSSNHSSLQSDLHDFNWQGRDASSTSSLVSKVTLLFSPVVPSHFNNNHRQNTTPFLEIFCTDFTLVKYQWTLGWPGLTVSGSIRRIIYFTTEIENIRKIFRLFPGSKFLGFPV